MSNTITVKDMCLWYGFCKKEKHMKNIITVKDMCLWYGDHQALKNININIPENNTAETRYLGFLQVISSAASVASRQANA